MFKNGIEYIVRSPSKKMRLSLIIARQMKRIVNASQNFAMLMFKHNNVANEAFQGDESNVKSDFIDVANDVIRCFRSLTFFLHKEVNKIQ